MMILLPEKNYKITIWLKIYKPFWPTTKEQDMAITIMDFRKMQRRCLISSLLSTNNPDRK